MGATTGWLRLLMCVMRGGGRVQEIMGDVEVHFGIVRPLRGACSRAAPCPPPVMIVLYSYVTHCLQLSLLCAGCACV